MMAGFLLVLVGFFLQTFWVAWGHLCHLDVYSDPLFVLFAFVGIRLMSVEGLLVQMQVILKKFMQKVLEFLLLN